MFQKYIFWTFGEQILETVENKTFWCIQFCFLILKVLKNQT